MVLEAVALAGNMDVLTVLVPRHPQRFDAVAGLLRDRGISFQRRSDERPVAGIYIPHSRPKDPWSESSDTFRDYELSIQSDGVPLTDHLLLTVTAGGKTVAQFVNEL